MILPIGHASSATRRLPWVTFGIMAICVLALLATHPGDDAPGWNPDLAMEEAAHYWRQHAYLEAEPEIRTRVGYDVMPNQRTQYIALMESEALADMPRDAELVAEQQAELDRLTDYALGRAMPPEVLEADDPYRKWGFVPSQWSLVTLITSIFMHAGWLHLLGNLFMLFLAGPAIEDRLGRPIFAGFYLLAGVFAALFWAALTPNQDIPLVGASGAIAGVLGAFLIRYWSTGIRFAYFFMFGFRPYFGTFEAQAWVMLPLWLLNEVFQGYLAHSLGAQGGVAYWAHVGGFLFGAAAVGAARVLELEEKYVDSRIEAKVTLAETNPIVEQALEAREQGDHAGALALLEEAWQAAPGDRDVALALWDAALAVDRPEAGRDAMTRLVRTCVSAGETDLAVRHWMELHRALPTALVDAGTLVKLVPILLADGDRELAVRALRHAVDPANTGLTTGLAFRAVELGREIDPGSALRAARAALRSGDVHEAKRARIEGWIAELEASGVSESPDAEAEEAARQKAVSDRRAIELPEEPDATGTSGPPLPAAAVAGAAVAGAAASVAAATPPPVPAAAATPPPLPSAMQAPPPLPAAPPPLPTEPEVAGRAEAREALFAAPGQELTATEVPPPLPTQPPPLAPTTPDDAIGEDVSLGVLDTLDALDAGPRFGSAKVVDGALTALADDGVRFTVGDGRKAKIDYARIEAISVVAVRGLGPKPVLLIDLLLNWTALDAEQLQLVRLASNAFDPRALAPDTATALEALRTIVARLREASGAIALPSPEAAALDPVAMHDSVEAYQREVLQVGG